MPETVHGFVAVDPDGATVLNSFAMERDTIWGWAEKVARADRDCLWFHGWRVVSATLVAETEQGGEG